MLLLSFLPPKYYKRERKAGSRVKNSDSVTNLRLTKFDDFLLYLRIFATK